MRLEPVWRHVAGRPGGLHSTRDGRWRPWDPTPVPYLRRREGCLGGHSRWPAAARGGEAGVKARGVANPTARPTTACSGPGPRFSSRHRGRGHRCAVPSADAERHAGTRPRLRGPDRPMSDRVRGLALLAMFSVSCGTLLACDGYLGVEGDVYQWADPSVEARSIALVDPGERAVAPRGAPLPGCA